MTRLRRRVRTGFRKPVLRHCACDPSQATGSRMRTAGSVGARAWQPRSKPWNRPIRQTGPQGPHRRLQGHPRSGQRRPGPRADQALIRDPVDWLGSHAPSKARHPAPPRLPKRSTGNGMKPWQSGRHTEDADRLCPGRLRLPGGRLPTRPTARSRPTRRVGRRRDPDHRIEVPAAAEARSDRQRQLSAHKD